MVFLKVVAKPIQMIALFNKDGSISPIRFKVEKIFEVKYDSKSYKWILFKI